MYVNESKIELGMEYTQKRLMYYFIYVTVLDNISNPTTDSS